MLWNYAYGFAATLMLALLLGFPVAAWCGCGRGVRALGYASACGASLLLIVCRGVQMISPIGAAKWTILAAMAIGLVIAWSWRSTRIAVAELLRSDGRGIATVLVAAAIVAVLLGVPILFSNAIQYDGTRNADSFLYTQNAQYMLGHAFYGAPDFTPEHPVYTISRGYIGAGAMAPRPAAEGVLAWMSALWGVDPMYLYNAVQAAGVMLAGLAALAFLPLEWRARSARDWTLLAVYAVACPTLLHVATNSNFANGFSLPAATAYVALGLLPRSRGTFVASVLFIGGLLSGYPELLMFVVFVRGLGVATEAMSKRAVGAIVREAGWMMVELIVAGAILPWAALAAITVFRTTFSVSHAGASELGGNMYAGVPMFGGAGVALAMTWRALGAPADGGRRWYLAAILLGFALAQGAMIARGFDYGGFRISEYFVTLLIGVALRSVLSAPAGVRIGRAAGAFAVVFALLMVLKSADVLRRAWEWSRARRVTRDLVMAGHALSKISHGAPVALGLTSQPFYYGMWLPYVASAPIAYDFTRDANLAGYLSPYLRGSGRAAEMFNAAQLQLDIDEGDHEEVAPVAQFGSVVIRPKTAQ